MKCKHLPAESWLCICKHVDSQGDLSQLARVSKFLQPIATEVLYKHAILRAPKALYRFYKTLQTHPAMMEMIRTLKLEWTGAMRVPPNMGMWFNTLMEAEKMEHLVVLTFPENRIPLRWRRSSSFDHSARHVDHVPQKLQSLETSFSFVERLPPFALRAPAAPLVALSLRGEPRKMHSILNEDYYPLVSALAQTLRRLRVAVTRPRWHHHPLRVCKDIGLKLPSLEYLEVCDEASAAKVSPLTTTETVLDHLPGGMLGTTARLTALGAR